MRRLDDYVWHDCDMKQLSFGDEHEYIIKLGYSEDTPNIRWDVAKREAPDFSLYRGMARNMDDAFRLAVRVIRHNTGLTYYTEGW